MNKKFTINIFYNNKWHTFTPYKMTEGQWKEINAYVIKLTNK